MAAAEDMQSPLDPESNRPPVRMASGALNHGSGFEHFEPSTPVGRFSRCFPCEPFRCCPGRVKLFIPSTWMKVQDGTHLALVIGIFAFSILGLDMVVFPSAQVVRFEASMGQIIMAVVATLFFICCAPYTYRVLGQYDEKLLVKQKQVKCQKENLTRAYNDLLSDMDGLLQKSAESSAGLAERSFESKRRDFQRFLERAKQRYSALFAGTKGDTNDLLKQFRRFCVNWLKVFEECSIDPILVPKRVVTMEELNRCLTISEVADLCLERLRNTEVRFISIQRDKDAQLLRRNRTEFRRLTVDGKRAREIMALPSLDHTPSAASGSLSGSLVGGQPSVQASGQLQQGGGGGDERALLTWITCGVSGCFGLRSSSTPGGFPKHMGCCCFQVAFLSSDHMVLVLGFLLGLALALLQLYVYFEKLELRKHFSSNPEPHKYHGLDLDTTQEILGAAEIIVSLLCVAVILVRFEDIDIVQQLEREVKELSKHNEEVEKQRDQMTVFWSNAQNLTDMWLYRTVPRLDLYKELHSQLEDVPQEDLLVNISGANQWLEDLDNRLGSLEAWRKDGALPLDDKKLFGKAINQLCQERDFSEILAKLEDVTTKQMNALERSSVKRSSMAQ